MSMPSTWMPRAATSVATRTASLPSEKSLSARSRCGLAQVAVDGGGLDAFAGELQDEAIGAPLGPDEHQRALGPAADGLEHLDLVELVHAR